MKDLFIEFENGWALTADSRQFILGKVELDDEGEKQVAYDGRKYFSSVDSAFRYIVEKNLRESDANNLAEFLHTLADTYEEIQEISSKLD